MASGGADILCVFFACHADIVETEKGICRIVKWKSSEILRNMKNIEKISQT